MVHLILARVYNGTDLGNCTHQIRREMGINNNTQALSTIRLLRVKED